ncbi:RTK1 [Symbiodinium sp. CCMP2592]|nr:RTK1 [Symbiodinium sp. CCMP2592]
MKRRDEFQICGWPLLRRHGVTERRAVQRFHVADLRPHAEVCHVVGLSSVCPFKVDMCMSKEQASDEPRKAASLGPFELPLPPVDKERFRRLQVLVQEERNHGQIELYEDQLQGCKVVGKRIFRSWTLGSAEEFATAHPDLLESPWKEVEISLVLGLNKVQGKLGVCKSFGAFRDEEGDILLFMEYISGGDLHDLASRCSTKPGPEREQKVWPVVLSLLRGVRCLHSAGVAHGDISLENALLGPDGEVRLIDFAAAEEDVWVQGIRGKPSYQAPEMHQSGCYDARAADLFACGVFAYCLACADYPWKCTRPHECSAFEFFMMHGLTAFLRKRRVRLADGSRGQPVEGLLSPELLQLMEILLNPDPARRYEVWSAESFMSFEIEPVEEAGYSANPQPPHTVRVK